MATTTDTHYVIDDDDGTRHVVLGDYDEPGTPENHGFFTPETCPVCNHPTDFLTSLNPFFGRMQEALEEIARGPHDHSIKITISPAMEMGEIDKVITAARDEYISRIDGNYGHYVEGCPSCTATQCLVEVTDEIEKREVAAQDAT